MKHNLAAGCSRKLAKIKPRKTAASQNLAMMMRPDKVGPTGPTCLNSFYWEVAPTERWLPNAKNVAKTSAKSLFLATTALLPASLGKILLPVFYINILSGLKA